MRYYKLLICVIGLSILSGCANIQRSKTVERAEPAELCVPIDIKISSGSVVSSKPMVLHSLRDGLKIPMQLSGTCNADDSFASALVPKSRLDNDKFKIETSKERPPIDCRLHWEDDGEATLSLYEEERLVFDYHYGVVSAPEGVPTHRDRSSYFHPLMGLDGQTYTADFPGDHFHHRGLFFGWPGIFVDGKRHDMWHMLGIRTIFERVLYKEIGPVFALITIENGWYIKDQKVMDEIMELKVWNSGKVGQTMDIRYTWKPLTEIKIGPKDYKGYGGLNFRFQEREGTVITNIDGPQKTSNQVKSPWADLSGRFEGKPYMSGAAIMNKPDNLAANPGWILRASDDFGVIGVAWPGNDTFTFKPGKRYSNHYRLWLHRGDVQSGCVEDIFDSYANSKTVTIEK